MKSNINKNRFRTLASITLFCLVGFFNLAAQVKIGYIKNPNANMQEKKYAQLKQAASIKSDLGNGQYLFKPFSLTVDKEQNLFVYDLYQGKIFKFDKDLKFVTSFGGLGTGDGKFAGTSIKYPVYLSIGADNKLYARDGRNARVLVFDLDGTFTGEIKYGKRIIRNGPVVDKNGNLHVPNITNNKLELQGQSGKAMFSFPLAEGLLDYILFKPGDLTKLTAEWVQRVMHKTLLLASTVDSRLLVYFQSSSTLVVLKDKKIVKKMVIRPKEAMASHVRDLGGELKKNAQIFRDLFSYMFTDSREKDVVYLQSGKNTKMGINALYQVDLSGKLLNVFYVAMEDSEIFTRFFAKSGNKFYTIDGDNVKIYAL